MTPDEAIVHVTRLLEAYPEVKVEVAGHRADLQDSYFVLIVTSISSLVRLLDHCESGANLETRVTTRGRPCRSGKPYDPSELRMEFTATDDGYESFAKPPAQPLQVLGVFLARDLKYLKLIPAEEADRLQKAFHGVVM